MNICVTAQPPHSAMQYAAKARNNSALASQTTGCPRIGTTLPDASTASFTNERISSPFAQPIAGYPQAAPTRLSASDAGKTIRGKRVFAHGKVCSTTNMVTIQRPAYPLAECAVCPLAVPPSGQRAIPLHGRTAGLKPAASLCPHSVVSGAPSQRRRNLVRLTPGLAFAPRSTGKPFLARDYRSPSKAQVNHVAHRSVLKSAPRSEASQRCT